MTTLLGTVGPTVISEINMSFCGGGDPFRRHDLPAESKNLWDRLAKVLVGAADAGLDMLFGDQHDMVVNVQSMLTVRNGTYPADLLQTRVLPCNHFQYFDSVEGQESLAAWLSES